MERCCYLFVLFKNFKNDQKIYDELCIAKADYLKGFLSSIPSFVINIHCLYFINIETENNAIDMIGDV